MLQQPTNERSDSETGAERRIALISDPAKELVGPQRIDRVLQFLLRGGEIFLGRTPGGFAAPGFSSWPVFGWRFWIHLLQGKR